VAAIWDALAKARRRRTFPSVSGTISLDADRNPVKLALILKIQQPQRRALRKAALSRKNFLFVST